MQNHILLCQHRLLNSNNQLLMHKFITLEVCFSRYNNLTLLWTVYHRSIQGAGLVFFGLVCFGFFFRLCYVEIKIEKQSEINHSKHSCEAAICQPSWVLSEYLLGEDSLAVDFFNTFSICGLSCRAL